MGETRRGGTCIAPAAVVVPETSSHRIMAGEEFRFKMEVTSFRLGSDPLTSNFTLHTSNIPAKEPSWRRPRPVTIASTPFLTGVNGWWAWEWGFPVGPFVRTTPIASAGRRVTPQGPACRNYRARLPTPKGEVRQIPLGDGFYAYVDAADYEWLSQWTWRLRCGYAVRLEKKTKKVIYMHREIMQPPKGMIVDHKSRNKLDNTRENLRNATHAENARNNGKRHGGFSSRFLGVSRCKQSGKWQACIWVEGGNLWLGLFTDEVEAARAYDRAAVEHFGEFARLNFPEEWPPERRQVVAKAKVKSKRQNAGAMHASPVQARAGRRLPVRARPGERGPGRRPEEGQAQTREAKRGTKSARATGHRPRATSAKPRAT